MNGGTSRHSGAMVYLYKQHLDSFLHGKLHVSRENYATCHGGPTRWPPMSPDRNHPRKLSAGFGSNSRPSHDRTTLVRHPSRPPRQGTCGASPKCRFTQSIHSRARSRLLAGSEEACVRPGKATNSVSTPLSFMAW